MLDWVDVQLGPSNQSETHIGYEFREGKPDERFQVGSEEGWTPVVRKHKWYQWKNFTQQQPDERCESQVIKN